MVAVLNPVKDRLQTLAKNIQWRRDD